MSRRQFLHKMLDAMKRVAMWSLLSNAWISGAAGGADPKGLHYHPLNGRSLRSIARGRHHHGPDRFVNPLGPGRQGRLWKVLRWKFFHQNRFKKYFREER